MTTTIAGKDEITRRLLDASSIEREGTVEEVGVIPHDRGDMAFLSIRPPDAATTKPGIVLCHSFFEMGLLQTAELTFLREVAQRGSPAIYVHAPGCGDSGGVPGTTTVQDRVDAATRGFDELVRRSSVERACFVGARFGGFVALRAAVEVGGASVVLWDPSLDPAAYLTEVIRLVKIGSAVGRMTGSVFTPEGKKIERAQDPSLALDPRRELDENGRISLLGQETTVAQLEDLERATLEGLGQVAGTAAVFARDEAAQVAGVRVVQRVLDGPVSGHALGLRDVWHLALRAGAIVRTPSVEWLDENATQS